MYYNIYMTKLNWYLGRNGWEETRELKGLDLVRRDWSIIAKEASQ